MTKHLSLLFIFVLLSFSVFGQEQASVDKQDTVAIKSDRLYLDLAFGFDFDNTEYLGSDLGVSETLFGVTLSPSLRYEWNEKHSLAVGASAQKWFGSKRFVDDIKLIAYYKFKSPRFTALTGMFPRNELIGKYSEAFFTSIWKTNNNLVQGATAQYTGKNGFAELAIDWVGMYSNETREQFYALLSGEGRFAKVMYAGGSASLQHYSNRADFRFNAVDNITINPYIGVDFKAFFDFDIRLGYLLSLQQDRMAGEGWYTPMGGELLFRMSRWGVFITNNLYLGKNLQPLYHSVGMEGTIYGPDLYASDPFYGTKTGIYNRTSIGYERNFWRERIKVRAEVIMKTDGKKIYSQQTISLGINLSPKIYDKANKRNI